MLINVDQLWKPASNAPEVSGLYLCVCEDTNRLTPYLSIGYYDADRLDKQKSWTAGYFASTKVTYWMPLPALPGAGNLMEIPSEATLQLYGSDSELACIKVETREGQSGAAIAVLIRTSFSGEAMSEAEEFEQEQVEDLDDDTVSVNIQPYASEDDSYWMTHYMSFKEAEDILNKEPKDE
jgi:hypothetical protein